MRTLASSDVADDVTLLRRAKPRPHPEVLAASAASLEGSSSPTALRYEIGLEVMNASKLEPGLEFGDQHLLDIPRAVLVVEEVARLFPEDEVLIRGALGPAAYAKLRRIERAGVDRREAADVEEDLVLSPTEKSLMRWTAKPAPGWLFSSAFVKAKVSAPSLPNSLSCLPRPSSQSSPRPPFITSLPTSPKRKSSPTLAEEFARYRWSRTYGRFRPSRSPGLPRKKVE